MTEDIVTIANVYKHEAINLTEQVKSLKIVTVKDFELAGEVSLSLARIKKQINTNWKPMAEKAKASLQEIKDNWNKELAPIEEAESKISYARVLWKCDQDRIERAKQEKLEREEQEKTAKLRQSLLDKAAAVEAMNPKKAEALLEKAEAVIEKPVFVEKTVEKTTKMESGGSITWIKDIEVTVTDIKAACAAVSNGWIPTTCVEFKGLKAWAKAIGNKCGDYYGVRITETQRESKRT